MPSIKPATVNSARAVVLGVTRAIAAILLLVGTLFVVQRVLFALFANDVRMAYNIWQGIGDGHRMSNGLVFLALGGALAALSRPIARWLTPAPGDECPRCGYAKADPPGEHDPSRCAECGLPGVNKA